MTRINSMLIRWRVQVRRSRAHKWVNKGLFETRDRAREQAATMRDGYYTYDDLICQCPGYGFGNTRVVRHEGKGK